MRIFSHTIYTLLFLVALTSCGKTTTAEMIESARTAIAAKDYELAAKTLDETAERFDSETPTASELSEMAVLYMIVNDNIPENGHDVSAFYCYSQAIDISPDSVNIFFGTLPPDESQYLFMLSSLYRSMKQPDVVSVDIEPDNY